MKKHILSIVTLALLTSGAVMAQYPGRPGKAPVTTSYNQPAFDDFTINQLDNVVHLSRKQEKELKKIEASYAQKASPRKNGRSSWQSASWSKEQKQKEMLSVLTSAQRQKWFDFQQSNRFGRDRYNRHS